MAAPRATRLDRTLRSSLGLAAAVFLAGGALCLWNVHQLREEVGWVTHTQEVLLDSAQILGLLSDAETGQRGFAITGDEQLLAPYRSALTGLPAKLDALAALTTDNARQRERMQQLRELVAQRLDSLARGIALRRESGFEAVREAIATGRGTGRMNALRALLGEVEQEERALLAERRRSSDARYGWAQAVIAAVAACGVALVSALAVMLRRQLALQRAADDAIAEQREWLQTTLNSIGDGVIATGVDGRVEFMNPVAEILTGWPYAEARGRPHAEAFSLLDESRREPAADPLARALAEKRPVGIERPTLLVARDGSERAIDDIASPVRRADGTVIGAVLVFRDVSERRRAERERAEYTLALDRQRELLRVTLESIGDGVIATDAEGRVSYLNPIAESLTGWTRGEAAGRPLAEVFEIVNEYTRQSVDNPVEKVLREGIIIGLANHTVLIARDRSEHPIEDSAAPIRDADRRIAGVVLVFHDASVSRDAQSRLRLSEQHLRESNALLAEADRRKDEFLATLAHELRNPLAPLRNALDLLGRTALDAERRERARSIMLRQTAQMARLIDELMDVSRISSGKIELHREVLELRAWVDAALEIAGPAVAQHQHELVIELPQAPVHVSMDRTRAAQVLSNLLNNAAKYTPPHGRIELRAEADADWLTIRLRDSGIGIAPELLPKIFEMFVQGERSTVQSHGGLGVGLSLARRLVQLHGGSLEASSEGRGRGSEFVLRLPRLVSGEAGPAAAVAAPAPLVGVRLLLVDDNREAADVLGELLVDLGATVKVVYDGQAAIAALDHFDAAAVLLDIGMPGIDGHQLAQMIRRRPGGGALTLIAISGWNQPGDRQLSRDSGIDHHLPKPTEIGELTALLRDLAEQPAG